MSDDKVEMPQKAFGLFNWAVALKCCQRQIREWVKIQEMNDVWALIYVYDMQE